MNIKKFVLFSIILFLLSLQSIVNAKTCDNDKISITSIELEETTENVTELKEAKVDDKNIYLNLSMLEVGNAARYKIVIKNDSEDDYELTENSLNTNSDYIDYKFELNDDSKILEKKSSKTVFLRVQYKNEVPRESFNNGIFTNDVVLKVDLSEDESNNVINPNTGIKYLLIVSLLLIISISLFFVFKKEKSIKLIIVLITVLLIPTVVKALCKYELNIHSSVVIDNNTYVYSTNYQYLGQPLDKTRSYFDNLDDALADFNHDFAIRLTIDENDIILDADLVYIIDDKVYYLNGTNPEIEYSSKLDFAESIFGTDNCGIDNYSYVCNNGHLSIRIYEFGFVSVSDNNYYCTIDPPHNYTTCGND